MSTDLSCGLLKNPRIPCFPHVYTSGFWHRSENHKILGKFKFIYN